MGQEFEYFWAWMAFFALVGFSWTSQRIKQYKGFPAFMCKIKQSKDKKHEFRKLKVIWIRAFNYGGSAAAIGWCLAQTYNNLQQIIMVTVVVEMISAAIIEGGLAILAIKYPEAAEVLKEGLYVDEPDEEDPPKTMFQQSATVLTQFVVGGGKGTRKKPREAQEEDNKTRVLTPQERAEITNPK